VYLSYYFQNTYVHNPFFNERKKTPQFQNNESHKESNSDENPQDTDTANHESEKYDKAPIDLNQEVSCYLLNLF